MSAIHQAFQWILDPDNNPDTDDAPDVVNNSWGADDSVNECIYEFQEDIQALRTSEIAVVFSAGNGGPALSTSISPANYPENFTVGAVDDNSDILVFSSRGPSACNGSIYPLVAAPGVNIRTADLTFGGVFPNSYSNVTGTSFAAAHVTGAMALLLGAYPCLAVTELAISLKDSAVDLGSPGPDNESGYGLIDSIAAYDILAETVTSTCPSSTSSVTATRPCLIEELYGSFSDETESLRYFRDAVLSKTKPGQEIIRLYYAWSPVVIKSMHQDEELKESLNIVINELVTLVSKEFK